MPKKLMLMRRTCKMSFFVYQNIFQNYSAFVLDILMMISCLNMTGETKRILVLTLRQGKLNVIFFPSFSIFRRIHIFLEQHLKITEHSGTFRIGIHKNLTNFDSVYNQLIGINSRQAMNKDISLFKTRRDKLHLTSGTVTPLFSRRRNSSKFPKIRSQSSSTFGSGPKMSPFERLVQKTPGPGYYNLPQLHCQYKAFISHPSTMKQERSLLGPGSFSTDPHSIKPRSVSYSIGKSKRKSIWNTHEISFPVKKQGGIHDEMKTISTQSSFKVHLSKFSNGFVKPKKILRIL